jgi:hypothetical protein
MPEIVCEDASITYSATETLFPGTGNVDLGNMVPSWFTSDLHLATIPADVLTAAQWNTGDPTTDIDGELRPTVDATADVAGADIP